MERGSSMDARKGSFFRGSDQMPELLEAQMSGEAVDSVRNLDLVIDRGGANHECLHGWEHRNDGMNNANGEVTKLTWADSERVALDGYFQCAGQNNKDFVTVCMKMGSRVRPCFSRVVVPNLKPV